MSACVVGRAGCAVPGWLVTTMDMSVLLLALPRIRAALNPLATEAVVDRRRRRVRGSIGRRAATPTAGLLMAARAVVGVAGATLARSTPTRTHQPNTPSSNQPVHLPNRSPR